MAPSSKRALPDERATCGSAVSRPPSVDADLERGDTLLACASRGRWIVVAAGGESLPEAADDAVDRDRRRWRQGLRQLCGRRSYHVLLNQVRGQLRRRRTLDLHGSKIRWPGWHEHLLHGNFRRHVCHRGRRRLRHDRVQQAGGKAVDHGDMQRCDQQQRHHAAREDPRVVRLDVQHILRGGGGRNGHAHALRVRTRSPASPSSSRWPAADALRSPAGMPCRRATLPANVRAVARERGAPRSR